MENKLFHSDRSLDFIMNNNLLEETILEFAFSTSGPYTFALLSDSDSLLWK